MPIETIPPPGPLSRLGLFLAAGLGLGFLPKAPGTAGTLLGVFIESLLWTALPPSRYFWGLAGTFLCLCLMSLALLPLARRSLASQDPKAFVLDEVSGYLVIPLVFGGTGPSLLRVAWGFCLFRAFDILKPFPVGWVDKTLKNSVGVLLDDLLSGLLACLVLGLMKALGPSF